MCIWFLRLVYLVPSTSYFCWLCTFRVVFCGIVIPSFRLTVVVCSLFCDFKTRAYYEIQSCRVLERYYDCFA